MAVKTGDKTRDKITLALGSAQGGQQNLYSSANCLMDSNSSPVWGWGVTLFWLFKAFVWGICMEMGAIYYHSDSKNVGEKEREGVSVFPLNLTETKTGLAGL